MGKGGGALSTWINEFCTLVFIQTIQAFTYAIIIVVIVKLQFANIVETSTRTAAMGLFTIMALVSVFKIEDLLRKIFGISPTKADHKSAVASLGKLAVIGHFGKRLTDNVGKITSGVGARIKSRKDLKKLNKSYAEDLSDLKGHKSAQAGAKPQAKIGATGTQSDGSMAVFGATVSKESEEAMAGNNSSSKNKNDADLQRKLRATQREYEQKRDEIIKARKEGMKQIAKGFAETGGSIIGGVTGGIIGISDGELDSLMTQMVAGAGVGDVVGEGTVNTISGLNKQISNAISATRGSINRVKTNRQLKAKGKETVSASTWNREMKQFATMKAELESLQETLRKQNNIDEM